MSRAPAHKRPSLRNHGSSLNSKVRSDRNVGKADLGIYNPCSRGNPTGWIQGQKKSRHACVQFPGSHVASLFLGWLANFYSNAETFHNFTFHQKLIKSYFTKDYGRLITGVITCVCAEHAATARLIARSYQTRVHEDQLSHRQELPTMHCGSF